MQLNKLKNIQAVYIHISNKKVETTQEVLKNKVYADLDADGRLVGFEFVEPYKVELDGEVQ